MELVFYGKVLFFLFFPTRDGRILVCDVVLSAGVAVLCPLLTYDVIRVLLLREICVLVIRVANCTGGLFDLRWFWYNFGIRAFLVCIEILKCL